MKKSIKKNYLYNLMYQLLIIISPIITTPYLARVLGPKGTGIYSYTISVVTYFILFGSLGTSLYGQREIAYNQSNKAERDKIFWELVLFRLVTMGIVCIIYFFTFTLNGEYMQYYQILLLELIANFLDINWFFLGLENFQKIVTKNFILKILSIILIFLFIKDSNDVNKYLFIYALTTFLSNFVLWFGLKKNVSKIDRKNIHIFKHLKYILILFIPQIAVHIYTILDKVMLGVIFNDMAEVGYYEQSQKIIRLLLTLITSLGAVMLPRIANLFAENKEDEIKKYMDNSLKFVFILAFPLIFGIISVADSFVPLFFGKGYDKVIIIMQILSPIVLFVGLSNVIGNQYLLTTKKQGKYTFSVLCGAIINFLLNIVLIKNYKSYGAALATIIAEFIVAFIQLVFIYKNLDIRKIIISFFKSLIASIVMFLSCLFVTKFIITAGVCRMITQIILGIIIYFGALFILKEEMFKEFLKGLKK